MISSVRDYVAIARRSEKRVLGFVLRFAWALGSGHTLRRSSGAPPIDSGIKWSSRGFSAALRVVAEHYGPPPKEQTDRTPANRINQPSGSFYALSPKK
jgi:hypothetical protein